MSGIQPSGCLSAAQLLAKLVGVGPGNHMALQLYRSLELVVGILSVLMTGAAYLPLSVTWPVDRQRFMVNDAACSLILTQTACMVGIELCYCGTVLFMDVAQFLPGVEVVSAAKAAYFHLAYVIYTSGSTGKPKGVLVSHVGVVNLLN